VAHCAESIYMLFRANLINRSIRRDVHLEGKDVDIGRRAICLQNTLCGEMRGLHPSVDFTGLVISWFIGCLFNTGCDVPSRSTTFLFFR